MSSQDNIVSHFSFRGDSFDISPSSSSHTPPPTILPLPPPSEHPPVIVTPCAACKILRRRCCVGKCILAPYFPPTDPLKFTIAHRVFGASNIIKFLQDLPEYEREDAVSSMVYEANARMRDPVYGTAGAICHLQRQVLELQQQLARAQAEILIMEQQQTNLVSSLLVRPIRTSSSQDEQQPINDLHDQQFAADQLRYNFDIFPEEDVSFGSAWEPLWA